MFSAYAMMQQAAAADGTPGAVGVTFPLPPGAITGGPGDPGAGGPTNGSTGFAGGVGVEGTGAVAPNTVDIAGGNGGDMSGGIGGSGGNGGGGLVFTGADSFSNAASTAITAGNGGVGGASGFGGAGGAGGAGIAYGSSGALTNDGQVSGGSGGDGGTGNGVVGGAGGAGGDGLIVASTGTTVTNSGVIIGGIGGRGGTTALPSATSAGGKGGAGIVFGGAGVLINTGEIYGGLGGLGGNNTAFATGPGGMGGSAVSGANLTIDNRTGTIAGGWGTDGNTANAITFTGGANVLTLSSASILTGNIGITAAGSTVAFDQGTDVTLANVITGAGGVTQSGAGILTLTGENTYTGGTTIASGSRLQIGDGGTTGSILGNVVNSGTLTFNRSDAVTFGGSVSGSGALVKTGTGTLTLTGASTHAGGTTITAGTLQIGDGGTTGSIAGDVANYGALAFKRSDAMTFGGVISGSGTLATTGTGTLTLAGINTYTGATTVDAGTLRVDGSIASSAMTTVTAGAMLAGVGIVGSTAITGGRLAPGNASGGMLTVQGNLTMDAASTFLVDVSPAGASRANVTGTAALGGATVNAHFAAGSYVNKQYTILSASGGLGGSTFGSQVNTNLPTDFKSSLSYDANNAYLNLTLNIRPPVSAGDEDSLDEIRESFRNATNVRNALGLYMLENNFIPTIFAKADDIIVLTQLSGETATGGQTSIFGAANGFMDQMTGGFREPPNVDTGGAGFGPVSSYAAPQRAATDAFASMTRKVPPRMPVPEARWNMWAAGFGGSQTSEGNAVAGSNNTRSSIYGMAVGADYWFSPFTVAGFSMAGGGTNFSVDGGGTGRSDMLQLGGFVRHNMGSVYVSAAAAYGWQDITTERAVTVAGLDQLRANFQTNSYSARIEAGNRFVLPWIGGIGLTPYAAGQVTMLDLPSYAESVVVGSGVFALSYAGKTVTAPRSELGLRSDKSFALEGVVLALRGRAAWAYDYNIDRSATATFQSLPGATFVVDGAAPARNAALTTATAELTWTNGWSVAATFEGEFSDVTRSYAGKGVVRYAW